MSFQSSKNLSKSMANNSAYEISLSKKKLNQSVILAIGVWLMLALVMPFEFKRATSSAMRVRYQRMTHGLLLRVILSGSMFRGFGTLPLANYMKAAVGTL